MSFLVLYYDAMVAWPADVEKTHQREHARFKLDWPQVVTRLRAEVERLDAQSVTVKVLAPQRAITNKGTRLLTSEIREPGVIVVIAHPTMGALRYACDQYTTAKDNVIAIVHTLKALRDIARWGTQKRGEQYMGSRVLAAPRDVMNYDAAAEFLSLITGQPKREIIDSLDMARKAARAAQNVTHPDRFDGKRDQWDKLEAARRALTSHHGASI